jgi:hypothetical protein
MYEISEPFCAGILSIRDVCQHLLETEQEHEAYICESLLKTLYFFVSDEKVDEEADMVYGQIKQKNGSDVFDVLFVRSIDHMGKDYGYFEPIIMQRNPDAEASLFPWDKVLSFYAHKEPISTFSGLEEEIWSQEFRQFLDEEDGSIFFSWSNYSWNPVYLPLHVFGVKEDMELFQNISLVKPSSLQFSQLRWCRL